MHMVAEGVKTAATARTMSQGNLTSTEKEYDLAIRGDHVARILDDGRPVGQGAGLLRHRHRHPRRQHPLQRTGSGVPGEHPLTGLRQNGAGLDAHVAPSMARPAMSVAAFSSSVSTSEEIRPARFSASLLAGIGPSPMISLATFTHASGLLPRPCSMKMISLL